MARRLPLLVAAGAGFTALFAASQAAAGGCANACPPPPCCNVPTTHQVTVPGIKVTPPSVSIMTPSIAVAGAAATATASAQSFSGGGAGSTVIVGGGGFGGFVEQGQQGVISNLAVETEGRPVCIQWKAVIKTVALQANCIDDKAVPHPASQVTPDRDIADGYEGEVYRCIAGTRLQYTIAPWQERMMEGGQTHACAKGEALYRTARGEFVCRTQKAARDCNERSLLRRYGAGIKVLKAKADQVCVEWGGQQTASAGGALIVDGGVGGIVH